MPVSLADGDGAADVVLSSLELHAASRPATATTAAPMPIFLIMECSFQGLCHIARPCWSASLRRLCAGMVPASVVVSCRALLLSKRWYRSATTPFAGGRGAD